MDIFLEGIICCSSLPQGLGCLTGLNTHQYPSGLSELASRATTFPTNVSRGGRGKRRDQVFFLKAKFTLYLQVFWRKNFLQKIAWSCFDGDIRMGWWNCIEGYPRNITIGPLWTMPSRILMRQWQDSSAVQFQQLACKKPPFFEIRDSTSRGSTSPLILKYPKHVWNMHIYHIFILHTIS